MNRFRAHWAAVLLICVGCGDDAKVVNEGEDDRTTFEAYFGRRRYVDGQSVVSTADGGYMVVGTGSTAGVNEQDIFLVKTNAAGDSLWTKTLGDANQDKGVGVVKAVDSGLAVMGFTRSNGGGLGDVYLVRINDGGDRVWAYQYGMPSREEAFAIEATSDGYVFAGREGLPGSLAVYIYVVKTDLTGGVLWRKIYGGTKYDEARGIAQTGDGGCVLVGRTENFAATASDVFLMRLDANGDSLWWRTYGEDRDDDASAVVHTADGGFMIAGTSNWSASGADDFYLIKTDAEGNEVWSKRYGGASGDVCNDIVETDGESFVLVGYSESFGAGGNDVYLIKVDAAGDTLWTRTHGGSGHDHGNSIQVTSDGGFVVAGTFGAGGTGSKMYLLKLDANGKL
ncbi:MAG: hypothetical protein OEV49_17340 [candidate division Zixibacteria bacterium]|nr:hypothetical protein [candidate division Zixibacteria bacterium]MDH3937919.1 hypothetical protein [candidate division Zixibacteria bacterium]MDH4035508.1 hypothetical protein [candidate division Zixibacteria bacterium]